MECNALHLIGDRVSRLKEDKIGVHSDGNAASFAITFSSSLPFSYFILFHFVSSLFFSNSDAIHSFILYIFLLLVIDREKKKKKSRLLFRLKLLYNDTQLKCWKNNANENSPYRSRVAFPYNNKGILS